MQYRVAVFGAGSVGCYVGGRLAHAGAQLRLIGRAALGERIARDGLSLADLHGWHAKLPPGSLRFSSDPRDIGPADLVLVTVKSGDTAAAAAALAGVVTPGALVLSLQNGLGHAETLRSALRAVTVLPAMVGFNVVATDDGGFLQASDGRLEVARHAALLRYAPLFAAAGLPLVQHEDMLSVQWGKLLLNLGNPVNALSGLPLRDTLAQRDFRRCLALAQREALALLGAAGLRPARVTPVPPGWLPTLLELPNPLFRLLAARMLAIDPRARTSMAADLDAGRRTEIDWLSGEVVRLAATLHRDAPVNARLVEAIREAEAGARRAWPASELLGELRRAAAQGTPFASAGLS